MANVLVIGVTGLVGRPFVAAAKELNVTLHALVRPESLDDPAKAELLKDVVVHKGSVDDYEALKAAMQGVDVVISTLGAFNLQVQASIVKAIQESPSVKRFVPSDFGFRKSPDTVFQDSKNIAHDALAGTSIEVTSIQANSFTEYFVPGLGNPWLSAYPEKVKLYGDGNAKVAFVSVEDVARYTLRAALDPRAANQTVVLAPPQNILSQNELLALWKSISGHSPELVPVSADEVKEGFAATAGDESKLLAHIEFHLAKNQYVDGLSVSQAGDLLGHELFPEVNYITVEDALKKLAAEKK